MEMQILSYCAELLGSLQNTQYKCNCIVYTAFHSFFVLRLCNSVLSFDTYTVNARLVPAGTNKIGDFLGYFLLSKN